MFGQSAVRAGSQENSIGDDIFIMVMECIMENSREEKSKQGGKQNTALLYVTLQFKGRRQTIFKTCLHIVMLRPGKPEKLGGQLKFCRTKYGHSFRLYEMPWSSQQRRCATGGVDNFVFLFVWISHMVHITEVIQRTQGHKNVYGKRYFPSKESDTKILQSTFRLRSRHHQLLFK